MLICGFARAESSTALDLLKQADEARGPQGNIVFTVTVKDFRDKELLRENEYRVHTKSSKLSMVETTQPVRLKGRKLLMKEKDLWLYLPSVKRPTRVSFHQRLTGEVSNGDIARTSFYEDYTPKIVGSDKGIYKILLSAKHKDTTYRKVLLWVNPKEKLPVKAHFFALSGKLMKTCEYQNFQTVLGRKRATEVLIQDAIQPKKKSLIIYSQAQPEQLDDSYFTKEAMQ